MKTLIVVIAASILTVGAHAQCGGSTYVLAPTLMTWHEGQAYAESLGGYLICAADGEEQWNVYDLLPYGPYWLGLTDEKVEGQWVWLSGEPVTYTNWGFRGDPPADPPENDYARGCINCGGWEAYPGDVVLKTHVIVEIPPGPSPDQNGDGSVNGQDLALVLGFWGPCARGTCFGDANCNGVVDAEDIAIVLGAWTG